MKVGIVGAGMIVHDFLTFAHEVTGMELVALARYHDPHINA